MSTYVHPTPRQTRMTDERRQLLQRLLAKPTLSAFERGQLEQLAHDAGGTDRDRVRTRLATAPTTTTGGTRKRRSLLDPTVEIEY